MYSSIKSWVNVPFQVLPFVKRNGAGTKQFDAPIDCMCYPKADVQLVTNDEGAEVISTTQLYVDGSVAIKVTDEVIFEGVTKPIQRIGTFYRNGVADIRVVYL